MDSFATRGSLKTLKFFADVDLNAVQLCPVPIQHRRDRSVLLGKEIPARFPTSRIAELTVGPTDAVTYGAHLAFTLKDADGFVLMTAKSGLE